MTPFIAALIALILVLVGLQLYMPWAIRQAVAEGPRIQVTLVATAALNLSTPDGFLESPAPDDDPSLLVWRPAHAIPLRPNREHDLVFRYDPSEAPPAAIRGDAEARLGMGGTGVRFTILVGETDARRLEQVNLKSELYAVAAERGVAPRDLPGWSQLEALDAELSDE
jgi:hypothetical protein